jgi:hypothetical protein
MTGVRYILNKLGYALALLIALLLATGFVLFIINTSGYPNM